MPIPENKIAVITGEAKPVDAAPTSATPAIASSPSPAEARAPRKPRRKGGAFLLAESEVGALKRAAADNKEEHEGYTYTSDPIEAATRGVVVVIAPRDVKEILDPGVAVFAVPSVEAGRERLESFTEAAHHAAVMDRGYGKASAQATRSRYRA